MAPQTPEDFVAELVQWARLIGGVSSSPKKSTANNPEHRLAQFKKAYTQLQVRRIAWISS
jgi:hypothetical protein